METSEIADKIHKAMNKLFEMDKWLIENDLSEQSISHKLAEYLQTYFSEYNVDCEYNGNVNNEHGRKRIIAVKRELERNDLLKPSEVELPFDLVNRSVFPDIIIHRRGSNDFNLCVIELKKSTNRVSFEYDKIKLSMYTTEYYGNDLKYDLGLFLVIHTNTSEKKFEIKYFINGELVQPD